MMKKSLVFGFSRREIEKVRRFLALLMIPLLVLQTASLGLMLPQRAIAEDGSVLVQKEQSGEESKEEASEERPEENGKSEKEKSDEPEKTPDKDSSGEQKPPQADEPAASAKEDSPAQQDDSSSEDKNKEDVKPQASQDSAPEEDEIQIWQENADGSMTTKVKEGGEYEFKDSGMKIKFTRIEGGEGEITIKGIELSDEQMEKLGALSKKAWDITSDMKNGSFEYELTLPTEGDLSENVEVIYFEDEKDLEDEEKGEVVEAEKVKVNEQKKEVVAKGLDHFTTFFIRTYGDATFTVEKEIYKQGETVHTKAEGLFSSRWYRIDVIDPNGNRHNIFACDDKITSATANYDLELNARVGNDWRAEVNKFETKTKCDALEDSKDVTSDTFEVVKKISADVCPDGGDWIKYDNWNDSDTEVTHTTDSGYVIDQVCIKYGQTKVNIPPDSSCHSASGLNTKTATVTEGQLSASCQDISHVSFHRTPRENQDATNINSIFECWEPDSENEGKYIAHFGWENKSGIEQNIPYGPDNSITPNSYENHFPTYFNIPTDGPRPGRTPFYPNTAVSISDWDGGNIVWKLTDKGTATAGLAGPRCPEMQKPVCGDGKINQDSEQCDGKDGVTDGENFCTSQCKLVPVYDGQHSCPVGTVPNYLETITLGSKNKNPQSFSNPLLGGNPYLLKASGTYRYDCAYGRKADAAYGTADNFATLRSDIGIWGTNRGVTSIIGDLGRGMGVIEWDDDKNINSQHVYSKLIEPEDDLNAKFVISDWYGDWYGNACDGQSCMDDNEGSLAVDLYECVSRQGKVLVNKYEDKNRDGKRNYGKNEEKGLSGWDFVAYDNQGNQVAGPQKTGREGWTIFKDLMPGDYKICELLQDGWSNSNADAYPGQNEGEVCRDVTVEPGKTVKNFGFGNYRNPVTISAKKVVCEDEKYLPNWGKGEGPAEIWQNTAADYVNNTNAQAGETVCYLEDQWQFQWGPAGSGSDGAFQKNTSLLGYPWKTFTSVDAGSPAAIYDISKLGGRIEVREVFSHEPMVGFSNSNDNFSSEFYCGTDVTNYDNWEWINKPKNGETYHCVGFNAKATPEIGIDKTGPQFAKAGDLVTYNYAITNAGDVPLSNVAVADDKCSPVQYQNGDTNGNSKLDLDETWNYSCATVPNWVFNTELENTATAIGFYGDVKVEATDKFKLYSFILRKDVRKNWNENVDDPHALFDVEVKAGEDVVGNVKISESAPAKMWVAEGSYDFCEVNVPQQYTPHYSGGCLTFNTGTYADWTHINYKKSAKIVAHKIVCESEEDLPNWGAVKSDGNPIAENTAVDFVSASEGKCWFEEGWQFEYGPKNSSYAGDDYLGLYGGKYHASEITDANGRVEIEIDDLRPYKGRIEMREVLQDGYLPFTYETQGNKNTNNVTAEFYCADDVMNYDNWEWIESPKHGETYHCVTWNVKLGQVVVHKFEDSNSNGVHDSGEQFLADWEMEMEGEDDSKKSQKTDQTGKTVFDLNPGRHALSEVMQDGWEQTGMYCDSQGPGDLITAPGEAFGHHGDCSGWNSCGNAETCAQWACEVKGYSNLVSYGDQRPCTQFGVCHLFHNRGSVQWNWGNWCDVMGVTDIVCSNSQNAVLNRAPVMVEASQPEEGSLDVDVNSGDQINCYVGNYRPGKVEVTKYSDENANGRRDEGEEALSGWDINLEKDSEEQALSEETGSDGKALFENLVAGNYLLSEDIKSGWEQTNISCSVAGDGDNQDSQNGEGDLVPHVLDIEEFHNSNSYPLEIVSGKNLVCEIGNKFIHSELFINKTNDEYANGPDEVGDLVTYTLQVEARVNGVNDVVVTDLPPETFAYVAGSWTANSDRRGDLKAEGITTEPTYASPGDWNLGDMEKGEVVTLTYQARIGAQTTTGVYRDLAWAQGKDLADGNLVALSFDSDFIVQQGIVDENFVGTQIEVVSSEEAPVVSVRAKKDEVIEEEEVIVKGATYPATGANSIWVLLALAGALLGSAMAGAGYFLRRKKQMKAGKVLGIFLALFSFALVVSSANAAGLSARLSDPAISTSASFNLDFVAMDILGREITLECQKKGPSDGGFSQFGSVIELQAGGDSGVCAINSAVLPTEGNYEFRVVAKAQGDEKQSNVVKTFYDATGPSTPRYIEKDEKSSCRNEVTFKTANDGQTSYVEIYRSQHSRNINADEASRIRTITIGPDQKYSFDDDLNASGCGDNYYYAVRAFDSAGNYSSVRAEEFEVVIEKEVEVFEDQETAEGAEGGVFGQASAGGVSGSSTAEGAAEGAEGAEGETGESAEDGVMIEQGAQTEAGDEADVLGERTGSGLDFLKDWRLWVVILALGAIGWWVFASTKTPKEEN